MTMNRIHLVVAVGFLLVAVIDRSTAQSCGSSQITAGGLYNALFTPAGTCSSYNFVGTDLQTTFVSLTADGSASSIAFTFDLASLPKGCTFLGASVVFDVVRGDLFDFHYLAPSQSLVYGNGEAVCLSNSFYVLEIPAADVTVANNVYTVSVLAGIEAAVLAGAQKFQFMIADLSIESETVIGKRSEIGAGEFPELHFDLRGLTKPYLQIDTQAPTTPPPTTQPVTTQPVTTQPVTTQPVTTQPVTTQPVTTPAVTTQPATTQASTTPAVTTQPATSQPSTTQPATTLPATTKPVTTQPATTQPATTPASITPVATTKSRPTSQCKRGKTGPDHCSGPTGKTGQDGFTGKTGQTGRTGKTGQDGKTKKTGVTHLTGRTAKTGRTGRTGITHVK